MLHKKPQFMCKKYIYTQFSYSNSMVKLHVFETHRVLVSKVAHLWKYGPFQAIQKSITFLS
jgi:hypothetical protein